MPSVAAIDNTVNPGDGGGGGGGSVSAIHGPLAPITAISLSVTSAATTSLYSGVYTLYSSGVATPTIRISGANEGNRIRLYAWDVAGGVFVCAAVSGERTAAGATEDVILSPAFTNGLWIIIAVLDDGSGNNTGCPSIGDVTGQLVSFVLYNLTIVASDPTSISLVYPSSASSYNTRPTVQVGGVTSGDTVSVYSDSTCSTAVGSTTSTGITADITLSSSLAAGANALYAKRTTSAGSASGCSSVNLPYTVLAPTGGLPSLAGVTMSMNGLGTPADYGGGLYVYSGSIAKPSITVSGLNIGNRVKIYQWENSGPYTCTNLVAETGADAASVDITMTTAATGPVVYVPVIDDGSGSDTGCPNVATFPAFPYAYYSFTPPLSSPTSLSIVTPSSSPGRLSTPTITVNGVTSGNTVSLYSDSTCTTQVATGVASSTSIDLTTSALTDGSYSFYAKQVSGSVSSACSTAVASYTLNTNITTPSALVLSSPTSSPGTNRTPTITVSYSGVVTGDDVNLYTDNACAGTVVAQATAASPTVDLTVSSPMTDGTYTFYSRVVNGSVQSACSSASVVYVLDSYYAKASSISMVTPSSNSGVSNTPTVRVAGVLSGDAVSLYTTSDCSTSAVGTATASGTTVDITTSALGDIGQYALYAVRSQGGRVSDCSVASVTYSVDIPPSSLSLYSPSTSPGQTVNPYITVSGVVAGDTVSLFTDSTCTTQVSTGTVSFGFTNIALQSSVLTDNTYEFYANRTKSGYTTSCSSAHVQYVLNTVVSAPTVLGAYSYNTSVVTGDLPYVSVSGVVSGDVIKIYSDSNCTTEVASDTSSGTSYNVVFTSPLADGYIYTFYAKRTNGYLHSDCSTTSAAYTLDVSTSVNFSKIYSIDTESNSTQTVTVTLGRAKPYATVVYFNTGGSTGTSGVDYNIGNSVTVLANQTTASVSYDLLTDGVVDGEKTLYLSMTHTSRSAVIVGSISQFRQFILDAQATVDSVVSISQNCAVLNSGKLKCWGINLYGTVGDGTYTNRTAPVVVDSGTSYLSVDSSYISNCGITSAHVLKCWGYNGNGTLGDGTQMNLNVPTVIDSGVQYSQVSAGYYASCGVTVAGVLKCWGQGNIVASLTPVVIDSGVSYSKVSAVGSHACAITTGGVLKCWGYNDRGQVGDGSTSLQSAPVVIDSGVTYSDVSLGDRVSCGITTTDELKCWGGAFGSSLSILGYTDSHQPRVIDSGVSYSKIDINYNSGNACAVTTGGVLKCWGPSPYDTLGLGYGATAAAPTVIDSVHTYSDVQGACAITTGGKLICWSSAQNFIYGNYGFGYQDVANPTPILSSNLYSTVSLLGRGCAITTTGQLNCWGLGWSGDGSNSITPRYYPVVVDYTNVYSKVGVGVYHTCAIQTNGVLKCWGENSSYQLGTSAIGSSTVPIVVDSGTLYSDISSGIQFSCGITTAGVQKCWGRLPYFSWVATPTVWDSGTLYSKISANGNFVCGLTVAGNIRCWGLSASSTWITTPTTFDSGTVYTDLSVSYYGRVCGVTSAGVLKCFYSSDTSSITVVDSGTAYSKVSYDESGVACGITTTGVLRCWSGYANTSTIVDAGTAYSMVISANGSQCGITTAGVMKCWGRDRSFSLGSGNYFMLPFNRSVNLETQ